MAIRPALPADAGRIADLFGQLGYAARPAQVLSQLLALPASDAALLAEDAGAVAGVVVVHVMAPLHVARPWALLSSLVVDETRRSGGVGAALLSAAEAFAVQAGCAQLELSSNVARTRAHQFYERHGYREKRMRFVKTLPA